MKKQKQINVKAYKASGFIGKYQELVSKTVIPYQHSVLYDEAPDTEKSHVAANFINAAKALRGEDAGDGFYGMVFQDSDAAKWIEATAYSLVNHPDCELERKADELIDLVAAAQDEDGYLNTYFTIKDREKRWSNLFEAHELYCAGHFIEAACAYYEATGKRKLLDVMTKNMEHIYDRFVTGGAEGEPGHPEIELALMKMYRLTGNEHALELCKRFIDKRGQDPEVFVREAQKRDWSVWNSNPRDLEYRQADLPVREQKDAKGHAVRAVYLYTGMADLASETGDKELFAACRRLWESIVKRRMYITGGIGSTVHGEAFTVDYDLPSDTAYCETCASIGLMFFASRMLENDVCGEYADVMELAFYNTVLAGMQLDGKRFFYVNPLQVDPGISGVAPTRRHDLPVRPKWYACACCPPNAARLIGSFGMYAYGESFGTDARKGENGPDSKTGDDPAAKDVLGTVYCHMYAAGDVGFSNGMKLHCETDYPYDMNVKYTVGGNGRLAIRIPAWSRTFTYALNGSESPVKPVDGYIYVNVHDGDVITLRFDGKPSYVRATTRIPNLAGMVAAKRGPLVYCFEGADNGNVKALRLKTDIPPVIGPVNKELGAVTLKTEANRVIDDNVDENTLGSGAVIGQGFGSDDLYSVEPEKTEGFTATAIPYYTWGNRGENEMRVWLPKA